MSKSVENIQFFRDNESRLKAQGNNSASGSSSTVTSSMISSISTPKSSRRGFTSPKGGQSPKGASSPKNSFSPVASPSMQPSILPNLTMVENNIDHLPPPYVPTEEETALSKRVYNSLRRIETSFYRIEKLLYCKDRRSCQSIQKLLNQGENYSSY
ncbi:hypothetical protein WA026_023608 [Henosepilachna vigintioctopunctata]|uniref:Uncharacterized protein n=1 Tax=Henosepilachna vigintioctopunctata TaxID=420089 RepID=A0AAW1UG03_9CUCU